MDLAITGLSIDDKFAMIDEMKKLATELSKWQSLDEFKFIDTASIPVIKMVLVYTCLYFLQKVHLRKMRENLLSQTQNELEKV